MVVCDYCGSEFATNSNLYRHVRRVHKVDCSFKSDTQVPQKKIPCDQCTGIFNNRTSLYRHRKKNHKRDGDLDTRNKRELISKTTHKENTTLKILPEYDLRTLLLHVNGVKLPEGYDYKELKRSSSQNTNIFVEFNFPLLSSTEAIIQWIEELKEINKMFFRKQVMTRARNKTVVFKKRFRCGHNVESKPDRKTPNPRQTKCPFYLCVIVFKNETRHTAKVRIIGKHNHACDSSLRFRDVSKDVVEKMLCLFSNGLGPAKAHQEHLKNLKDEYGENFYKVQGDRNLCPDIKWIYNLRYKFFKKQYGPQFGIKMLGVMKEKVDEFNREAGTGGARLKIIDENNNYVLSLVTPFMIRVHEYFSESCEIAFIDTTGTTDLSNCKVFSIITNSCVGALPLGVIITTSENTIAFSEGLTMFKSLLSEKSFGGRGILGPQIFMTDVSSAEHAALKQHFPETIILLCDFHILRTFWRHINDDNTRIESGYKTDLFNDFKKLLNASDSDELQKKIDEMLANDVVKTNPNFVSYFNELYERKEEWAKCFRSNMITREQNTNISEASMRVLKDSVMRRFKTYSLVHLFKILTTDFESHYIDKLVDICNNRIPSYLKKREMDLKKKCIGLQYNGNGKVTDTKKNHTYDVNTSEGICTCPDGASGHLCKHLYFLVRRSPHDPLILIPENQEEKELLYYIATGNGFPAKDKWSANHNLQPSPLKRDPKHLPVNEDMQSEESSLKNFVLNYAENNLNDFSVSEEIISEESVLEDFNLHDLENDTNGLLVNEEMQADELSLDNDVNNALADFKFVYENIVEKVKEHSFLAPYLLKMTRNYSKIHTLSSLKTALDTFGTFSDNLTKTSKRTQVQPMSKSRRIFKNSSKHPVQLGRSLKQFRASEHEYLVLS